MMRSLCWACHATAIFERLASQTHVGDAAKSIYFESDRYGVDGDRKICREVRTRSSNGIVLRRRSPVNRG
jgi:hypothetical protein